MIIIIIIIRSKVIATAKSLYEPMTNFYRESEFGSEVVRSTEATRISNGVCASYYHSSERETQAELERFERVQM